LVERALAKDILKDPADYYVNVHNAEFPPERSGASSPSSPKPHTIEPQGRGTMPWPFSCPYSPNILEGLFPEVRL
jgi:hypothetical protein